MTAKEYAAIRSKVMNYLYKNYPILIIEEDEVLHYHLYRCIQKEIDFHSFASIRISIIYYLRGNEKAAKASVAYKEMLHLSRTPSGNEVVEAIRNNFAKILLEINTWKGKKEKAFAKRVLYILLTGCEDQSITDARSTDKDYKLRSRVMSKLRFVLSKYL